jgi:FlgD Ig-like domain
VPWAVEDFSVPQDGTCTSTRGRSAVGRTRTRLQSEATNWGVPFAPELGALTSGPWTPTAAPASHGSFTALDVTQGLGVTTTPTYKWRARVEAHSPYFPWTPWLSPSRNGRQEFDLRTRPQVNALAVNPPAVPRELALTAASPNPSHGLAKLAFTLPLRTSVDLSIFDVSGRRVAVLADGPADAGEHAATWDGRDAAGRSAGAGVYFVRLVTPGRVLTRKLVRMP